MGIIRNLIVLRDTSKQQAKDSSDLLRLMVCNEPFGSFVLDCLNDTAGFCKNRGMIAIPQDWAVPDIRGQVECCPLYRNRAHLFQTYRICARNFLGRRLRREISYSGG